MHLSNDDIKVVHKRCSTSSLGKGQAKQQGNATSHLLGWRLVRKGKTTSAGRDAEKLKPCALLVGVQDGAAAVENSAVGPQTS